MSSFGVIKNDMGNPRLTHAAIESLIAGDHVVDAPAQLTELVATLRRFVGDMPSVPVSGALREFIVDGARSPASIAAEVRTGRAVKPIRRPRLSLAKVAAALGLIPAPILLGVAVAAAALGGAYVVGVDLPLLPDPHPPVEIRTPATTIPVDIETPASVVPETHQTNSSPPGTTPQTLPEPTNGHGSPGCEAEQNAASGSNVPADPCAERPAEGAQDQSPPRANGQSLIYVGPLGRTPAHH